MDAQQERLAARQAKRSAKAAARRQKSDAFKEEGNALFRKGDFHQALDKYQCAIDVHGPSQKPVLLANMAAAYLQLDMYPEAHEAADKALTADPTSIKARYRRGMARKNMDMWTAADIDFRTVLTLDPDNETVQAELDYVEEMKYDAELWEETEDIDSYSDHEAPALDDDPDPGDSLSESSDCEHTGNGIPCKFYNRSVCKNGHACRYSHAPDDSSERDALGRNVCRYYLMGVCKFGERCSYLHSKEYLLHEGWWSTMERVEKTRKLYEAVKTWNKSIATFKNQIKASEQGQKQKKKKKQPKGRKRRGQQARQGASGSTVTPTAWQDDYDSDGAYEGTCGFTGSEVEELLCQGVKPWDDDAWDVMDALHSYY